MTFFYLPRLRHFWILNVHYMTQVIYCKRRCSQTQLIAVLLAPRASQIVWRAMGHLACGEQTLFSAFVSPAEKRASLKIVHVWFLCFSDKHCLLEIWEVNDAWERMHFGCFTSHSTVESTAGGKKIRITESTASFFVSYLSIFCLKFKKCYNCIYSINELGPSATKRIYSYILL